MELGFADSQGSLQGLSRLGVGLQQTVRETELGENAHPEPPGRAQGWRDCRTPQWVWAVWVCPVSAAPMEVKAPVLCPQVKCIILQVLKGLQYLHENYIIHRWEWQDGAGGTEGGLGTPLTSWEQQQGREAME